MDKKSCLHGRKPSPTNVRIPFSVLGVITEEFGCLVECHAYFYMIEKTELLSCIGQGVWSTYIVGHDIWKSTGRQR